MADLRNAFGIAPDVDEEQALRELFPTANAGPATEGQIDRSNAGELQRGLRSGFLNAVQASPRALVGAAQDALGFKSAAEQSYENVRNLLRRGAEAAPTTKWSDVKDVGSLGRYAAGAVGNAMATTLPAVAVGLATRSPRLGLATMFPMEAGEPAAEVAQMPADQRPDPGSTLRTSLAKGAVNTAIEAAPFMHMFGRGPLAEIGKQITNPVARFGGRALTQMGAEGGTEYLQEVSGQVARSHLQPGRDTSGDPEERAESFRQGFFGAAPFGGMAGVSGAVQDAKAFARSGVDKATDFIERSKGKPAADILKDISGSDREKRYSMYINGNPTAEEDVVKHGKDSTLYRAIREPNKLPVSVRQIGDHIDQYLRGEGAYADTKVAAQFVSQLENLFGSREAVDNVLEKYAKGINDTGTLNRNHGEVKAEMDRPPAWLDSDGVTSFSEADLGLNDEDRKAYVAEEHGLQNLTSINNGYFYDGTSTSKRPFSNKNAARAGVSRVQRMNSFVTSAESVSLLDQAYETGQDPEEIRSKLYDEMVKAQKKDVAAGNNPNESAESQARIAARVRNGNDILKKLGERKVDPETGEIVWSKTAIDALSDLYAVRTNGTEDDQNFAPGEVRDMASKKGTEESMLTFSTPDGKKVNINARLLMKAHMKRSNNLDDAGALIPARAWMYRSLMSGLAGLMNPKPGQPQLTLETELDDNLVVYKNRGVPVTLGELKQAEASLIYRNRNENEDAADAAERERRADASAFYRDAAREGPEGTAGEGFDPTANTLRDQQPGGAPQYAADGTEIFRQENVRNFNENLVGDPDAARVGTPFPASGSTEAQFEGTFKQPPAPAPSQIQDAVGTPLDTKIMQSEAREAIRGALPQGREGYGEHKPVDWPADRVWPDDAYQTGFTFGPEELPQAPEAAPYVEPIKQYDLSQPEATPTSDELKLVRAKEAAEGSTSPKTDAQAQEASKKRGRQVARFGPSERTKLDRAVVADLFERLNAASDHFAKLTKNKTPEKANTPNMRNSMASLERTYKNVMEKADQLGSGERYALQKLMTGVRGTYERMLNKPATAPQAKAEVAPEPAAAPNSEPKQGEVLGEPPKAEPKPKAARKKRTPKVSKVVGEVRRLELLASLKRAGGVKLSIASDITGDKGLNATRSMPGLFRKNGMDANILVEYLQQNGYLPQNSDELNLEEEAFDFVRAIVNKEPVYMLEDEGRYSDARAKELGVMHTWVNPSAEARAMRRRLRQRLFNLGLERSYADMKNNVKTAAGMLAKYEQPERQHSAYVSAYDLMMNLASVAKNKKAEKWLRENVRNYTKLLPLLEDLAPHLEDKKDAVLAKALIKSVARSTTFKVETENNMRNLAGGYAPGDDAVRLREGDSILVGVVLHEAVHAATVHALANNPAALDALHTLLEHVRSVDQSAFRFMYGETNTLEFLAEGLTNPALRAILRQIPPSAEVRTLLGDVKDMWHAFVRVIRQALGMSESEESALSQFLDIAGTLMKDTGTGKVPNMRDDSSTERLAMASTPVARREGAVVFEALKNKWPVLGAKMEALTAESGGPKYSPADVKLMRFLLNAEPKGVELLEKLESSQLKHALMMTAMDMAGGNVMTLLPMPTTRANADLRSLDDTNPLSDERFTHMDTGVSENKLTKEEMDQIKELIKKQRGDQVILAFKEALEIGPSEMDEFGHETKKTRAAGKYTKDMDDVEGRKQGRRLIELAFDVSYATAESAAYHEAMHDFLASLRGLGATPQTLSAAAAVEGLHKNVEVMMQLKELLKDHPEAWKAAQDDANEAAAYIYQFWVKGHIKLAPAPRNVFEKLAKFFRDVLNIVSQDEKARMLMDALSKGDFAKMSVAENVINKMKAETFAEKSRRVAGPLMSVSSVLITSTTDRLREMNIPAFNEIADLFHKEADQERGRIGYLQKSGQMNAQWKARLNQILSGYTDKDFTEALEAMQSREDSALPLVKQIREMLNDMFDYMSKANVMEAERSSMEVWDPELKQNVRKEVMQWVPIKKVGYNYFPRVWDQDAIARSSEKFVGLLMKHGGLSEIEARDVVKAITSTPQSEMVDETSYTPYMMSANNRRLHFINKANSGEFAEFQKKDLVSIMTDYVSHSVRRAESTRAFGHGYGRIEMLLSRGKAEGATEEDVKVAQRAVAAMTGSLRHDMDRGVRQIMNNLVAYENVVLLPFALLNNLTDVVHVALRSGDLSEGWRAFGTGVRELKNALLRRPPSEQKRFAEALGMIDETVALGAYGEAYEGMYMTGFARKLNDAFFKYNGMQTWNHAMRTAATQAGLRFIVRHATGEKTEHSDRYLYELGLDREFVSKLIDKEGKLAVFREDIANALGVDKDSGEAAAAETKIQEALYRFADDSALRPNAAHRPIWGSDPYYMLLFHLKQFTYTFQAVTAKFINKEMAYGSVMPVVTLMAYAPFALAIQTIRSLMLGKPIDSSLSGILMSLAKSGTMLGTGTFGIDALRDTAQSRIPGISFIGPAPAHGLQALQTLLGADGTSLGRLAERSVPLSPLVKAFR